MAVEGVSWVLKLGCWESKQPQNTPERKSGRSLEAVFWRHRGRTALAEWPSFLDVSGDQWDKGRKDLRGICELHPETITFMVFSSEIPFSTDALAPDTPQGVKGRQKI